MSRGVGERTRRAASAEGLPLALKAGGSARASLAGAHANGGEQTRDARMQGKRGIGSIAGMVAAIAAMTLVRMFRWNELGLLDRVMIALLWIAVAAGVDCYRDNAVALSAHSVRGERANSAQSAPKRSGRFIEASSSRADDAAAGTGPAGFGGL